MVGNLNVAEITDFIDGGGNMMIAASSDVSELLRELAAEVGGKIITCIVVLLRQFIPIATVKYGKLTYSRKWLLTVLSLVVLAR